MYSVYCTWVKVSESVPKARLGKHTSEGSTLLRSEARLLGDMLGSGVVDVQVQVPAVQVPGVHHWLQRAQLFQVLAHVGLPVYITMSIIELQALHSRSN